MRFTRSTPLESAVRGAERFRKMIREVDSTDTHITGVLQRYPDGCKIGPIADAAHKSEGAIRYRLLTLEASGLVRAVRERGSTTYFLNSPDFSTEKMVNQLGQRLIAKVNNAESIAFDDLSKEYPEFAIVPRHELWSFVNALAEDGRIRLEDRNGKLILNSVEL